MLDLAALSVQGLIHRDLFVVEENILRSLDREGRIARYFQGHLQSFGVEGSLSA